MAFHLHSPVPTSPPHVHRPRWLRGAVYYTADPEPVEKSESEHEREYEYDHRNENEARRENEERRKHEDDHDSDDSSARAVVPETQKPSLLDMPLDTGFDLEEIMQAVLRIEPSDAEDALVRFQVPGRLEADDVNVHGAQRQRRLSTSSVHPRSLTPGLHDDMPASYNWKRASTVVSEPESMFVSEPELDSDTSTPSLSPQSSNSESSVSTRSATTPPQDLVMAPYVHVVQPPTPICAPTLPLRATSALSTFPSSSRPILPIRRLPSPPVRAPTPASAPIRRIRPLPVPPRTPTPSSATVTLTATARAMPTPPATPKPAVPSPLRYETSKSTSSLPAPEDASPPPSPNVSSDESELRFAPASVSTSTLDSLAHPPAKIRRDRDVYQRQVPRASWAPPPQGALFVISVCLWTSSGSIRVLTAFGRSLGAV